MIKKTYHFNFPEVWYSPWESDEVFNQIYSDISGNTLVSKRKLYDIYCISRQMSTLGGNYLEIGTLRGGTAALLASTFTNKELILWDNWGKYVEHDAYFVEKIYSESDDLAKTRNLLKKVSLQTTSNFTFVDEPFPNLKLIEQWHEKFSLVHFDIYDKTAFIDGIKLLWPKIQVGGVFIVSAYGSISLDPLTISVNEFVKTQKDCLFIQSQSGLGLLFKKCDGVTQISND